MPTLCSDAPGCPQVSTLCGQQASVPVHWSPLWVSDFSTRVHQAAAAGRQQQVVKLHVYLDDHQTTISVLQFLGWIINYEKSNLVPSRDFSSPSGCSSTLDNSQWRPYRRCVARSSPFISTGLPTRTSQPGICTGFSACWCSWLRWYDGEDFALRPVQWWAATAWCQRTGSWSDQIQVPQWVLSEVAWWASPAVLQGLPLAAKETEVTVFTDASSSGWEAQLGSRSTRGQSASQRSWHINALEMQAVINAVRDSLPHQRSRAVRLMCDNAVTVAYIKNEGGMRSHTVMQLTIPLLKWCNHKAITLVPVHLPGVHNIQADSLSRVGQTLTTEWTMAMERLRPMFAKWGEPQVDPCDICQQTTHQVRIPISGPQGRMDRCHVHALGQREGPPVRVPAIQDGPSSTAEDRSATKSQDDFDRSTATGSVMVSGVDGSVPRRSDPAVYRRSRPADSRRLDRRRGDRDSSFPAVKSTRVETLRAILSAKGHSREAANMMSRCLLESSLQMYESHWSRFVAFCRTKRWYVFPVRSHHFSTYMMHLFRDRLLPSTIISHRTSVASVLRHWVYDPAADPHIKLLVRAFWLERPVQCRIMPKWDLHLVLLSLLRPPFASDGDEDGESSDDVIPLKWRTMKCVFLLALASARPRSYLHALSIAPGRCVFTRGNTQRQLVVSLLPEPGFLAKKQLPTQAEWITVPGIAHLNLTEAERMLCPVRQLKLYIRDSERIRGGHQHMFIHCNGNIRDIMRSHMSRWIVETVKEAYTQADREYDRVTAHEVRAFQLHGRTNVRWPYLTSCRQHFGGHLGSSRIRIYATWPVSLMACRHWVQWWSHNK